MEDALYVEVGRRIREQSKNVGLTRYSIAYIELGRQKIQLHVLYHFSNVLWSESI